MSGSLTKGNAPLVKLSAPLIKLSAPLIKLSAPLTILSVPLMNLSRSTFTMEFQTSGSSLTHHKQDSVLTNQWLTYKRKCSTCKIECPAHNIECPAHEFEWLNRHHGVPNFRITRLNSSHLVISYAVFCLHTRLQGDWSSDV